MTDAQRTGASTAPPTIRRSDYRPPEWRISEVDLDFTLDVHETVVRARLTVARHGANPDPLALDVDGCVPDRVRIDGADAPWRQDGARIVIPGVPDRAVIELRTRLNPQANSQLMGLYASGGMLCTQCEAEGFRRIIPFIDRPDNLAVYTVRMEADQQRFPILLSNGSCTQVGDLDGGRHFVVWHDPWPKPSYLFALVAGNLVANRDVFTTRSGQRVDLAIWVRDGDLPRTSHAMHALKAAMAWDERVYGREYDLPVFNIVAVSDFNMGAMENKGLNIFNTRYVLADPDTATDLDYDGIEAVIAHEYFHNWSGNRVTCRDWFQLSLKEGFTVYRDQSFSADQGSASVKRIEDVRLLRATQFPEDAGPLAHPVRPDSYQEISNFYTATVYNKGAEVIRMMATLLGPERFRAGTDLYFARHDGEAATCEDFIRAMEEGGAIDLTHFRRWYEQAGTPRVSVQLTQDADSDAWTLRLAQHVPPTPGQPDKQPMPIPLRIKAFDRAANADRAAEQLVVLGDTGMSIPLGSFAERPMLSINRGFTAPVTIDQVRDADALAWLAAHDDDAFARYEALQQLMIDTLVARVAGSQADAAPVVDAVRALIADAAADPAFVAEAIALPTEAFLGDQMLIVDPDAIRRARRALQHDLGAALDGQWRSLQAALATDAADLSPRAKGQRKLRGASLMYLFASGADDAARIAFAQFSDAAGMTDRQAALATLAHSEADERIAALDIFYHRYRDNPLVLDKWFQVQAWSLRADTVAAVAELAQHSDFTLGNPNRVRSLYGAFSGNQAAFHQADGAGYRLLADLIIALDPRNPQTAARMIPPFGRWRRFDEARQALMRAELERILAQTNLSRDVTEQASKSLD